MGTHPIFESDFDCLTVYFRMSKHVTSEKRRKSKNTGDKNKKRKKNKFTYSQPVKHHYKRTVQLDIRIKPHASQLGVQTKPNTLRPGQTIFRKSISSEICEENTVRDLQVTVHNE